MRTIPLILTLLAASSLGAVEPPDEHPLKEFFEAEKLTNEEMEDVHVELEIPPEVNPQLRLEVYHTDLEKILVGALLEIHAESIDLTYDVLVEFEADPYEPVTHTVDVFRGDEIEGENVEMTVKEIGYVSLPEIDRMEKPSEDDEESDESEEPEE